MEEKTDVIELPFLGDAPVRASVFLDGPLKEQVMKDHRRLGYRHVGETLTHVLKELYFPKKAA